MYKIIFLIKRKPTLTHEQFKDHYEKSHARLAHKYLGHLMISYVRNYIPVALGSRKHGNKPVDFGFDVITEWILPNEEAWLEIDRIFKDPVIWEEFLADEHRLFDRDATITFRLKDDQVRDTGVTLTEQPTLDTLATRPA